MLCAFFCAAHDFERLDQLARGLLRIRNRACFGEDRGHLLFPARQHRFLARGVEGRGVVRVLRDHVALHLGADPELPHGPCDPRQREQRLPQAAIGNRPVISGLVAVRPLREPRLGGQRDALPLLLLRAFLGAPLQLEHVLGGRVAERAVFLALASLVHAGPWIDELGIPILHRRERRLDLA
ncbi:MAG: hypothetical protein QM820_53210 [Minicystis sp.]